MSSFNQLAHLALLAQDTSERARLVRDALVHIESDWNETRELIARHEEVFGKF